MNFDFLFQNYEGVFSLTKRKTKVLTFFSLAGIALTIVLTVVFAFNIDRTKYIPGIIVLGTIFALNIIILIQGNYKASLRVIYLLPIAIYFFYINSYYSVVGTENALPGLLTFTYFGFLFLIVFGESLLTIVLFFTESLGTLLYFLYVNNLLGSQGNIPRSILFKVNPITELVIAGILAVLLFIYFNSLITKTSHNINKLDKLYHESLKQSAIGIMILTIVRDAHGEKAGMKIIKTNSSFEKFFKVTKSDLSNSDFSEVFPVIFRNSFDWQETYFYSKKSTVQVYIEHLEKWFLINNMYPETDMIISCFTNITDLKNEISKLQSRENRLTNLLGSLPDIFFIIEKDGTYIDYVSNNPELLKMGQKDIVGKTIFEMGFSKSMSYQIYSSIQYVIENDNIETIEYGTKLSNGKTLIFEMRLARLNENQVISIGRDITASKEYEQELIEARKRTEEANRLKSSFLENISHEIRTPMNAILGFSNMAASDMYGENEKKKFLDVVIKNGEQLMEVITNIIDISEIESGTIKYTPSVFKVNEMFMDIYHKYKNRINSIEHDIDLKLEIANNNPAFLVENDNYLLLKILNHLIENAIKFTKKGTVTFGYEMVDDKIKIFARDTGIGINKKDYATIFEFFHQVDNRISRAYSGTGAGLKIVKGLTQLIGTTIEFESQPGKGSVFYFYIPANNNQHYS